MNNKNTQKINFQHVYYKKFIIAKEVYYYKKFITKSKGERKNLSEIYKQQGKRQGWKKKTQAKSTKSMEKGKGERKTRSKIYNEQRRKKKPTILIPMIRDQIHYTISLYQHNVLQHSFMNKLREESVSFCGDSFIPRVVEIGIVTMGCHPIELPPF